MKEGTMVIGTTVDRDGNANYVDLTEIDVLDLVSVKVNEKTYDFKFNYVKDEDKTYLTCRLEDTEVSRVEIDPEELVRALEFSCVNDAGRLEDFKYILEKRQLLIDNIK